VSAGYQTTDATRIAAKRRKKANLSIIWSSYAYSFGQSQLLLDFLSAIYLNKTYFSLSCWNAVLPPDCHIWWHESDALMIAAILRGLLIFKEIPGIWTATSAGVIIINGIYVWYREQKLQRSQSKAAS
jgi:hypothetical protein